MTNSEAGKDELSVYEVGYLVLPSIPEDKIEDVTSLIKGVITKHGGLELDSEAPIKRELAYSMSKTVGASRYVLSDAYLGWLKFEALPKHVLAIKAEIGKIKEVLRFLLIKAPRETTFTFAKAKALAEEKKSQEASPAIEQVVD